MTPRARLDAEQVLEILRLDRKGDMSVRTISARTGVSPTSVHATVKRARAAGLSWDRTKRLSAAALGSALYGERRRLSARNRAPLDLAAVHRERVLSGTSLRDLWLRHRQRTAKRPYSYSHFCFLYGKWRRTRGGAAERA